MINPENTKRTMKSSCRSSKTRRKSVWNNTVHKMTSQNICRNIHPVFVVLLAVSKYEWRFIINIRNVFKSFRQMNLCLIIKAWTNTNFRYVWVIYHNVEVKTLSLDMVTEGMDWMFGSQKDQKTWPTSKIWMLCVANNTWKSR